MKRTSMQQIPFIQNLDLNNKRVFLRADLNVPLDSKTIVQDFRLEAILPTIDYIKKNNGKVILATHLGRPNASSQRNFFDEDLSTEILAEWFEKKDYKVTHEGDLLKAIEQSSQNFDEILMLENLRFFNAERECRIDFAELLTQCADIYINDAFGLIHRTDCSITLLPQQFDKQNRAFGLLVEKEINELRKLKESSELLPVLGGSKIKTKINLLNQLVKTTKIKKVLIGGAIANTFVKAQGLEVGKSKIEDESLSTASDFLETAKKQGTQIILPIDAYTILPESDEEGTVFDIDAIPSNMQIVDIGPKTIKIFAGEIKRAKTIFVNGTVGIYEKPAYEAGSKEVLQAVANSSAHTVIGGGDAVAATHLFGLEKEMDFLSTGGGATLALLASEDEKKLPAIEAMI